MCYAEEIFNNARTKDNILWTALLTGYTQHGECEHVFRLYDAMKTAGMQPNAITFLSLLNACSHSGLIDRAYKILEEMGRDYGIVPTVKHHNCILDLLSRAGQVIEAMDVLDKMPTQPSFISWSTVLGHCRNQGNVKLAKHAFECALTLGANKHSSAFVLMSNMLGDLFLEEYEEMIFYE
jgi:pentatricopeptide repeat protein